MPDPENDLMTKTLSLALGKGQLGLSLFISGLFAINFNYRLPA